MNNLEKTIKVFKNGGIVIFPTDTAFGIGCRMDNVETVKKVYEIRKRPEEKAVLVLVDSIQMAEEYFLPLDHDVKTLMEKYWPGGLTIIYNCKKDKVPNEVRAGGETLGIRLPDHKELREVIKQVGFPIIAPSANVSGGKTPFSIEDIDKNLLDQVDFVMEGECSLKKPSTLIDCSTKPWKIIRQGAVEIKP